MFILLHWYCHRGFGCGRMITFTLKIFNIFGDVYTRDGTISLGQRDASAQIVVNHNYPTQVLGSIPFTPSVVTKWHDRHRYLSIHHMPHLMSLSSPRHCSKTLTDPSRISCSLCLFSWILQHFAEILWIHTDQCGGLLSSRLYCPTTLQSGSMNSWLWRLYFHFLGSFGISKFYEYMYTLTAV